MHELRSTSHIAAGTIEVNHRILLNFKVVLLHDGEGNFTL